MTNLLYWLLAILMFGILVMLHEFGHFIAARLTGVTVLEFAVGFGPKLLSRKAKSGVTYSVRLLPFGGYCRFVADEEEGEVREDAFSKEKIWKRALISFAGPLMNVLTALLLLFVLCFAIGVPVPDGPIISGLMPGLPAEEAGFAVGDVVREVNGVPTVNLEDVGAQLTAAGDGNPVTFTLERDGERIDRVVSSRFDETEGRYMVGIEYHLRLVPMRLDFVTSVENAFSLTGQTATAIVTVLRDLIFKGEGMDDLAGPIGTMTIVKEQTEAGGIFNYIYLAAVISVNLGLFNLLPIPGLDGSRLVFLLIEKIRGKPLDPNKEGIVTLIGFALLMGLMVLALYQDIVRLLQ